jgi:hypothetical protein
MIERSSWYARFGLYRARSLAGARLSNRPGPGWHVNPGFCPNGAKGKRVRVILANGFTCKDDGGTTAPPGWAADTARWDKTGFAFDIEWYKVL